MVRQCNFLYTNNDSTTTKIMGGHKIIDDILSVRLSTNEYKTCAIDKM